MGLAMSDVFLKAPTPKSPMDQKAYDFISGFYSSIGANSVLDQKQLYNNIDGLGMMIYGPISESMEEFRNPGNETFKGWMAVHEISHSLLEGGDSLVAK